MNRAILARILGACLIFLAFIYFGYNYYKSTQPTEIPVIEAESGETKIKPTDAGGIILPHSDSAIYENMGKGGATRKITIMPEPEQALPVLGKKNIDVELEGSIDSMLASIISEERDVKAEDELVDSVFDEVPPRIMEEPTKEANDTTRTRSLNVVNVTENNNKRIGSTANYNPPEKGNYKIQLTSMKSESLAIAEGERIKRKHSKILSNVTITHKKVQQEKGKFFYIILAGDYSTLSKAKAACKKLSSRQQSCMIYQP